MRRRLMSEPAAWEFLADKWSSPILGGAYDIPRVMLGDRMAFGLCSSIACLWESGGISPRTREQMQNRLILNKPKRASSDNFWWPRTPARAKTRARFARRMAKQARAEGV